MISPIKITNNNNNGKVLCKIHKQKKDTITQLFQKDGTREII